MSAFNAFFAQLTGGGPPGTPSVGGGSHAERGRGNPPSGGGGGAIGAIGGAGGIGGGDGGGSDNGSGAGGSEVFGVPLKEGKVSYYPESDRRRFGNPQVRQSFRGDWVGRFLSIYIFFVSFWGRPLADMCTWGCCVLLNE